MIFYARKDLEKLSGLLVLRSGANTHAIPWVLFGVLSVGGLVVIILLAVVISWIPVAEESKPKEESTVEEITNTIDERPPVAKPSE